MTTVSHRGSAWGLAGYGIFAWGLSFGRGWKIERAAIASARLATMFNSNLLETAIGAVAEADPNGS